MFDWYKLYKDKKLLKKNNYFILQEQLSSIAKELYNMRKSINASDIIEGQSSEELQENYNKFLLKKYDRYLGTKGMYPPEELHGIVEILNKDFKTKNDKYIYYVEYRTKVLKPNESLEQYNKLKYTYTTKRIVLTKIYDALKGRLYFPDVAINEASARASDL